MITAFISGKVVSHNRDRRPIICSVLMIAKQFLKKLQHLVVKLIFITHVLEAIGSP